MRSWHDSDPPSDHLACATPVTLTRRAARSTRHRITDFLYFLDVIFLHSAAQDVGTLTKSRLGHN